MFQIYNDMAQRRTRAERAPAARRLILREVTSLVVLAIPVAIATYYDMTLLRFRLIAGALGIDDPQVAGSPPITSPCSRSTRCRTCCGPGRWPS